MHSRPNTNLPAGISRALPSPSPRLLAQTAFLCLEPASMKKRMNGWPGSTLVAECPQVVAKGRDMPPCAVNRAQSFSPDSIPSLSLPAPRHVQWSLNDCTAGCCFDDFPRNLRRHAVSPDPACLADEAEHPPVCDLGGCCPNIHCRLDPARNCSSADMASGAAPGGLT